jgi:cephalosporin-C deacetylase
MALFDLPLDQLKTYLPAREEPPDFDAFWQRTLAEARAYPLDARFEPADFGLRTVETFDVTFNGYGGQPIKGWLILPRQRAGRLPCVVEFVGYGGGRSYPANWLLWSAAGYANLVMDTRGQGSAWSHGDTPDPEVEGSNPYYPGFMTRGILRPETYYYRRVFTNACRAIEAAQAYAWVDPTRIAVAGASQGGGITIAAAALSLAVQVAMPDVPFLCHFRRAATLTDSNPYMELQRYLMAHRDHVDQVFATLSYFDGVNFAVRARARALFSVALMDDVCPPSTVFAAYNHWAGEKAIRVYEFNRHEGGGEYQAAEKVRFLQAIWPTA